MSVRNRLGAGIGVTAGGVRLEHARGAVAMIVIARTSARAQRSALSL
jgi:hypothetical protein